MGQVEYMIMVCKAVQGYASSQAPKLERVRDGRHIMSQLTDVASDLSRQREKILAVYDVREVSRSADRLGDTLKAVYDVLGDVEDTSVMFGKKKGFGKRVSALVHDIGTHANSLLAATSLAIADRYQYLNKKKHVWCRGLAGTRGGTIGYLFVCARQYSDFRQSTGYHKHATRRNSSCARQWNSSEVRVVYTSK